MFRLFKNKIKFIDENLKPNDRIISILSNYIQPELSTIGFSFNENELTFKRTNGDFENTISFQKNKWNSGNKVCAIKPIIVVQSKKLADFYKETKNEKAKSIGLCGEYNVENILGWNNKYFDGYYDFAKHDNFELVELLKNNIFKSAINFLDTFITYEDIVKYYLEKELYYFNAPKIFDLCKLNNDKKNAEKILDWVNQFQNKTLKELPKELINEIKEREQVFNNWSI